MSQTLNGKRVCHNKTLRLGVCKGSSNSHRDWYNILWDGEDHCYRYARDEFKVLPDFDATTKQDAVE